jgi:hypothetical protein
VTRCQAPANLPDEFKALIHDPAFATKPTREDHFWPGLRWRFRVARVHDGEFAATFHTVVQVSKLAPLYNVQHEFEVVNRDDQKMGVPLAGSSGRAYTRAQFRLAERLASMLQPLAYQELQYADMIEVVPELSMPANVHLFGSQVTVGYALFNDLLQLCES